MAEGFCYRCKSAGNQTGLHVQGHAAAEVLEPNAALHRRLHHDREPRVWYTRASHPLQLRPPSSLCTSSHRSAELPLVQRCRLGSCCGGSLSLKCSLVPCASSGQSLTGAKHSCRQVYEAHRLLGRDRQSGVLQLRGLRPRPGAAGRPDPHARRPRHAVLHGHAQVQALRDPQVRLAAPGLRIIWYLRGINPRPSPPQHLDGRRALLVRCWPCTCEHMVFTSWYGPSTTDLACAPCRYEPFVVAEVALSTPRQPSGTPAGTASGSASQAADSTEQTSSSAPESVNPAAGGSGAFNALAGYIFGGNAARDRMAMTTPVFTDSRGSMQFVVRTSDDVRLSATPCPLITQYWCTDDGLPMISL